MKRVAHAFDPNVSADATSYRQYTASDQQIPTFSGFDSDSQSHSNHNLAVEIDLVVEINDWGVSGSVIWDAQARGFANQTEIEYFEFWAANVANDSEDADQ